MKFLLDHDVPTEVARVLSQGGHEVVELRNVLPRDTADAEVLRYARLHQVLLVTCNRDDFLELAAQEPTFGLVILIRRRSRMAECSELLRLIDRAGESGLLRNINYA
jgi:predicted nuclease of predicted toxin-antitoxin system